MSDPHSSAENARPFVRETATSRTLHFSIATIQSRMDLADPDALALKYTRTIMGFLLLQPAPRLITMIGLGGGSLAKFCHRFLPAARIEVIEINQDVIALRDVFHVPPDGPRFRVIRGDGAQLVRYRTTRPDILVVDGFDDDGQPTRLCTQRFYDDCYSMLNTGGVLAVNLHQGDHEYDEHVDRIHRAFHDAVLVIDDDESSNSVVLACRGPALDAPVAGVDRCLRKLDPVAAAQLAEAFETVGRAIEERRNA